MCSELVFVFDLVEPPDIHMCIGVAFIELKCQLRFALDIYIEWVICYNIDYLQQKIRTKELVAFSCYYCCCW